MNMQSKRQLQVASLIKRNFGTVLQREGSYIYGSEVLVTVTNVSVTPDLSLCKIYLSVFNTENKQSVILLLDEQIHQLKQSLAHRIRKHIRRIPDISVYLDETLDEMYRLNKVFGKLKEDGQM